MSADQSAPETPERPPVAQRGSAPKLPEALVGVVEALHEAVLLLDQGLRVRTANRAFYRTWGVSPEETESRSVYAIDQGPWDTPQLRTLLEEILPRTSHCQDFEVEHDVPGVGRRTLLVNARQLPGPESDPGPLILLAIEDVTARGQAEEQAQRLDALIASSNDAIIGKTLEGLITSWNAGAERMYGYSAHEVLGKPITLLVPPDRTGEYHDILEGIRRGERIAPFETRRVCKDGRVLHVSLTVSPIKDAAGQVVGVSAIARDISERRALQREVLEVATQEQRRIGQDLHDSTGQELTGLGLLADTLVEQLTRQPHPGAALATRLAEGIRHALGQLRSLARGLIPVEVDAGGLQASLADLAASVSRLDGIRCTFRCPEPVDVEDQTTATHLYRIAQEGIANALTHGRARTIDVILEWERGALTLKVRDDGVGLRAPAPGGQGMGLRIMHYRATLMDATVSVRPAEEGGTLLTCTLPQRQHR